MLINGVFLLAAGLFAVLVSYGKVNISKDRTANAQYIGKYGGLFRIVGIVMIVCGVALAVSGFMQD